MNDKYGQCVICGLIVPKQYLNPVPMSNKGQLKMVLACNTCRKEMLERGGKNE